MAVAAALVIGCHGAAEPKPAAPGGFTTRSAATATPPDGGGPTRLVLPGSVNAAEGAAIVARADSAALHNFSSDGDLTTAYWPEIAVGDDEVVVSAQTYKARQNEGSEAPPHFRLLLWRPSSGETKDLWSAPAGTQDIVTAADGDWVSVLQIGMSLPFPDWQVSLRNLATGEIRDIAASDPIVAQQPGLPVGAPFGFAPYPAMSDGKVAWLEWVQSDGATVRRLILYDIATLTTTVEAESKQPREEDMRSVSLSGGYLAWLHDKRDSLDSEIVVRKVSSGATRTLIAGGTPEDGRLADDGTYFVWDLGATAKYAVNLATLQVTFFAGDVGDQTATDGHWAAWSSTGPHPRAGVYDLRSQRVRYVVAGGGGGGGGASGLLGHGLFFFREIAVDGTGSEIPEQTRYRIVRLQP